MPQPPESDTPRPLFASFDGLVERHIECHYCGYDLQGCELDGDCPDCGHPIQATMTVEQRKADAAKRFNAELRRAHWRGLAILLGAAFIIALPLLLYARACSSW